MIILEQSLGFLIFFSILEFFLPKNYYFSLKIVGIVNELPISLIEIQYVLGNLLGIINHLQGRNHREMLAATSAIVGRICPPWLR